MFEQYISYEEAMQMFSYDPLTGEVTWKVQRRWVKPGRRAGTTGKTGHRYITVFGKRRTEHRLVWLLAYGYMPKCQIDHINKDRADNRLANLRLAPNNHSDNAQNQSIAKNNKSGVVGVMWHTKMQRWQVQIGINHKKVFLGTFTDFNDAVAARRAAELNYFTFANP